MARDGLRLVSGGAKLSRVEVAADPAVFQDACLEAMPSHRSRAVSARSPWRTGGVLDRFLVACGRPAWEVTRDDVDRVVAGLTTQGLAASTRRGYVQAFKGSTGFLSLARLQRSRACSGSPGRPGGRVQRSPPCRRGLTIN